MATSKLVRGFLVGREGKVDKMERRLVLQGLVVGGVALTTPTTARARQNDAEEPAAEGAPSPSGNGPWELLAPVGPGSELGGGWTACALSTVSHGAAILTLAHPTGANARVHVCRRAGASRGVASTKHLDFMLMNGAAGSEPTDEALSRAVKTVALRVAQLDDQRDAKARPAGLLPHPARLSWFGSDGVLE